MARPTDQAIRDLAAELEAATVSPKDAIGGILLGNPTPQEALSIFARLTREVTADIADELLAVAVSLA